VLLAISDGHEGGGQQAGSDLVVDMEPAEGLSPVVRRALQG